MAWRLSLVPSEAGPRARLVRKLSLAFPAIEWNQVPDLPFASPKTRAAIQRRGNPVSGSLSYGQLTIDLNFPGEPECVTALAITIQGQGEPLPFLKELVHACDGRLTSLDSGEVVDVTAAMSPEWDSLAHRLRVRIGGHYGPLDPTLPQVDQLLDDILTGRQLYGGIVLEDAAERREFPRLHIAHATPNWCLEFSHNRLSWAMCTTRNVADVLIASMLYGDPLQIRQRCLLTHDEVLQGVNYFLEHRARNPNFRWLDLGEAYNLR